MSYDIIGFTSILLVIFIVVVLANLRPVIALILYIGLGVRVIFIYIHNNIMLLPDSSGDSINFVNKAYLWSRDGFLNTLDYFPGIDSFFISWVISIFYSLFGDSVLMAQSISLLFGMGSIYIGWIIAEKLWNKNVANKAAWLIALFPSLILYSSLVMRETYVCFFLLIALNYSIEWLRHKNLKYFIFTVISFIAATFFHGAMIIGLIFFIIVVLWNLIKIIFSGLLKFNLRINEAIFVFFVIIVINFFYTKNIHIAKLGNLKHLEEFPTLIVEKSERKNRGSAKYDTWMIPKSETELFYKAPIKMIYFLFSPFLWDIKKKEHIIGFFDGSLYIYLFYLIVRNFKNIWTDPASRFIFLLFLLFVFAFGISIMNFGTGIRHRSKFVIILIILAAPLLPKLFLYKKN